jgi:hypothetical protein
VHFYPAVQEVLQPMSVAVVVAEARRTAGPYWASERHHMAAAAVAEVVVESELEVAEKDIVEDSLVAAWVGMPALQLEREVVALLPLTVQSVR